MKKFTFVMLLMAACLIIAASAGATIRPLSIIGNSAPYYSPDTIVIAVGDSLLITNNDAMDHTVTSDSSGLFDTGNIAADGTAILTFNTLGEFGYHCALHPAMVGKIIVIPAAGGVQFNNASISIITASEISAAGGATPVAPYALAIDTNNNLFIDDDPSGGPGNFVNFNFLTRTGTVVANEADYAAVADATGDLDIQSFFVAGDGTVVIGDRDTGDEVIKATGRTPGAITATNLGTAAGIADLTLAESSVVYYATEVAFGGQDDIKKLVLPSGTANTVITFDAITAASGAGNYGAGPIAVEPDGKLLIFDEAAYGGSDMILRGDPNTGVVTVAIGSTSGAGYEAMRTDSYGNIYTWNEYRSGGSAFTFLTPDGTSYDYTTAAILPGLGITLYDIDNSAYGFTAVTQAGSDVYFFAGNTFGAPQGDIIVFKFPVYSAPIAMSPTSVITLNPGGTQSFTVSNGTAPYTWSLETSAAGQGSLDTTSGTSVIFTAGTSVGTVRVKVTDANGNEAISGLITVTPTSAPLATEPKE